MTDPTADPLVSIVIVTYGTGPIVVEALEAIARCTPLAHEVIVVDNPVHERGSPTAGLDGRSDILLVRPTENLGFAGGNELGVRHASGTFVCFLNPDVIVDHGWLEPLVDTLDDPVVGIAAPVLVNPDGTLQEAGQLLYPDACTAAIGGPEVMTNQWANVFSRDVDYASAACWVVRRLEHIERGGFDIRYHPAYFEDVDYALRVELEGMRTRLVADVPVVHHHGQGGSGRSLALGEASQATFRAIWTDTIAGRPQRPATDDEVRINRDRLVADSRQIDGRPVRSGETAWRDLFADAVRDARHRPRDRVTMFTDVPLPDADRAAAASAGLEVRLLPPEPAERRTVNWTLVLVAAFLLAPAGVLARWLILRSPAGALTADEAYTGVESFEIVGGRIPVVLGGTSYTLPFEGYLYAPFAALLGANVVVLKLLSTVSWALASAAIFFVGRQLSNRRTGLVAAAMCWITPGGLLSISVTAYSGYASGLLVTVVAFFVAAVIVDSTDPRRWVLTMFGAFAGFGFWLHPMFLASLVPMVLVVLWTHRRRRDAWLAVVGGGIVGCAPLLAWNAVNSWPSLDAPVEVEGTYTDRLRTFAVDLVPRAFGLRDGSLDWQPNGFVGPILYLAILLLTLYGVVVLIRRPRPPSRFLLPAVLLGVFPIMALFQNLIFAADGRYGIISFPFLVIAMAVGIDELAGRDFPARFAVVAAAVATVWIGGLIVPTVRPLVVATDGDPNAHLEALVERLDDAGIDRIYGSYWAVLPVDFVGDRHIVGGVFPFWPIRFPERQRTVEATPIADIAILFLTTDEEPIRLPMRIENYERTVYGDIVLYLPIAAPGDV
jgi:GT2 family glycosyltransferase